MIKYRTRFIKIEKFEIEKKTNHTITIGGYRENKRSEFNNWHNSFENAREFLLKKEQINISICENRIKKAIKKMKKIEKLLEE